jgi:hypothetical protein
VLLPACASGTSEPLDLDLADSMGADLALDGFDPDGDPDGDPGADLDTWVPGPLCPADYELPPQGDGPQLSPHESWKTSVGFDWSEAFYAGDSGGGNLFMKFTVFVEDLDTVYFQNTNDYLFHYEFAADRLAPFEGLNPEQFDQVTLYNEGRVAILGAIITPPWFEPNEVGVQLVSRDPLHPKLVRALLDSVAASLDYDQPVVPLYFPTAEQDPVIRACVEAFEATGVTVSSVSTWGDSGACFSTGYAIGRLREVRSEEIQAAYLAGDLLPTDILLTDLVPAELPILAGLICTLPSTMNSHVAIYSQSLGTPFAWLSSAAAVDAARAHLDQEVLLVAQADWTGCSVQVVPTAQGFTPGDLQSLKDLKQLPPLEFPAKDCPQGLLSLDTAETVLADAACFGGKAVGLGVLNRALPDNSPEAVAISLETWDALLATTDDQQRTLGDRIHTLLAPFHWPPDMAALDAALAQVRLLIKDAAPALPQDLQGHILDALAGFDPATKVRVRSSSNAEDAESFVAAGLYESYSACLADDLDEDDTGPSACNPAQSEERGFFRAARKVFESFYTLEAFAERLRRGVNEADTGMALVVHHSFPDSEELANGVGILTSVEDHLTIKLVSQPGAASVTNPEGGATAEEVEVSIWSWSTGVYLNRPSNLVLLGDTVLTWDQEYLDLADLMVEAAQTWAAEAKAQRYSLDFEYKKLASGKLILKQLRRLPLPGQEDLGFFLLPQTTTWCVLQGEGSDLLAIHRAKSRLTLTNQGAWVAEDKLTSDFLTHLSMELLVDGAPKVSEHPGDELQGLSVKLELSEYNTAYLNLDWKGGDFGDGWGLTIQTPYESSSQEAMFGILGKQYAQLRRQFSVPQLYIDYDGTAKTRKEETAPLTACYDYPPGELLPQERSLNGKDGLAVTTRFNWPPVPKGPTAGYTAPAVSFISTTISGLTTEPLVLTSPWAQTYHALHHNFGEDFLFEPALDPAVTSTQLAELEAKGIRALIIFMGYQGRIWLASPDWQLTEVTPDL